MKFFGLLTIALLLYAVSVGAQTDSTTAKPDADELARQMSNPVGTLGSMVFQGTWAKWDGDLPGASDQSSSALIFMPTLPWKMGSGNLIVRPSFPVAGATALDATGQWSKERGFGDMIVMAVWGRNEPNGLLWGVGATSVLPTATNDALGQDQFQLGPAAMLGYLNPKGVFGLMIQQWWGINPPAGESAIDQRTLQLFYWFSLSGGWQIGGSPIVTANYVVATDTNFSFPFNFGVARTFVAGSTPIKATIQAQYFVTRPEHFGPSWGVFFQITPVVKLPWGG